MQTKLDAYSQRQSVWYKPADWERYEQKVIEATSLLEQAQPIYNVLPSMASKSSENLAKAQAIFARKNQWGIIFREDHETIEQAVDRTYQELKVAYEEMLPLTNDITPIASVYQRLMPSFEQQNPLYRMLNDLTSLENYIESTATTARREHEELSKGFAENHKILVSNLNGRLSEDDEKALLEALTFDYTVSFNDTETAVFVNYDRDYKIRFNHDGTLTVHYTTDGSEDTVPLSLFARQDTNAQPSYTISYRYEHAPEGLVPPVAVSKKIGEVIDFPQDGEVITRSEGTYRLSWDKSVNRVPSSNYEVVGIWEFIPITRYDVTYEFRSTDGSQLPEVVQKLKPIDQIGVVQGTQVTPPETFQDQLEARGLWRFEGWDKTSQLVQDSPLRFIGTWEFVKNHELLAAIAELETEVILSNRILTTQNYQQASNRLAYDQSLAKARAILANSQSDLTAIREALTSLSTVKNSLDGDQRIATSKVEAAESTAQAAQAKLADATSDQLVTPTEKSAVDDAIAEARTALSEARRAVDSLPSGSAKTALEGRLGAVSLPASPAITDSNSNGRLDSEEAAEAKAIAEATSKVEAAESTAQAAQAKLADATSDQLVTPTEKSAVDEAIAEARTALSEARRAVDSLPSGSAKTALEGRLGAVSLPASPAITDSNSNGRLDSEEAAEAKAIAEATSKVEAAESTAQAAQAKLADATSDQLVTPAEKTDNVSMGVDKTVFPSIQQSVYRSNLDIESRLSSTSQPSTSSIPSLTVTQTEPESLKSADSSEDILSSKPSVQPSNETVQQIDSNTLPLIIALGGTIFLISGLAVVIIKRKKHDD
ncbi:SHIRT domain-containing protein [Streptococcus sp. E17BB]